MLAQLTDTRQYEFQQVGSGLFDQKIIRDITNFKAPQTVGRYGEHTYGPLRGLFWIEPTAHYDRRNFTTAESAIEALIAIHEHDLKSKLNLRLAMIAEFAR